MWGELWCVLFGELCQMSDSSVTSSGGCVMCLPSTTCMSFSLHHSYFILISNPDLQLNNLHCHQRYIGRPLDMQLDFKSIMLIPVIFFHCWTRDEGRVVVLDIINLRNISRDKITVLLLPLHAYLCLFEQVCLT